MGSSHVWLWAEVNAWLRALELDDGEARPTRTQMSMIDLMLLSPGNWTVRRRDSGLKDVYRRTLLARRVADMLPLYELVKEAETETL